MICLSIGIISIKAEAVNYTYGQYNVQYHMGNSDAWVGATNFNTGTTTTSYDYIKKLSIRLGYSNKYSAGVNYTITIETGYSPINSALNNNYLDGSNFDCYGVNQISSWSPNASYVSQCSYVGATRVPNTNHVKYVYNITLTSAIQGIQININLPYDEVSGYGINSVNVYTKTAITYGENITGAIEEQTIILENAINEIETNITNVIENSLEDILGQDHAYRTENPAGPSQAENETLTETITDYFDDLDTGFEYHITIPTGAAQFIWYIIDRITAIEAIRTLIISILCLGLVKMILNR